MPDYGQLTFRGVLADFFETFEPTAAASWANKLAYRKTGSVADTEKYKFAVDTGGMKKAGASLEINEGTWLSRDIDNVEYQDAIAINKNHWRFDQSGTISMLVKEKAVKAALFDEYQLSQLINAGTTTACYDSAYFFSTTHNVGKSGNQSNAITYDAVTATAPTSSEIAAAVGQGLHQLFSFVDETGQNIVNTGAKEFIFMAPKGWTNAVPAIRTTYLANTSSVIQSPLGGWQEDGIRISPVINPFLTATDTGYLFRIDGVQRPLIIQERTPIEVTELGENSDEFVLRNRYVWKVSKNCAYDFMQWRHAVSIQMT